MSSQKSEFFLCSHCKEPIKSRGDLVTSGEYIVFHHYHYQCYGKVVVDNYLYRSSTTPFTKPSQLANRFVFYRMLGFFALITIPIVVYISWNAAVKSSFGPPPGFIENLASIGPILLGIVLLSGGMFLSAFRYRKEIDQHIRIYGDPESQESP